MLIWAVSDVTRRVRQVIEEDPSLGDVWVEGEISNFVVSMSGHAFFSLKDDASQLKCVMFRHQLQRLRKRPANGEQGIARGAVRVYEAQGVYQLYAEFLAPSGLGELQIRLEELRLRLEAEGLFDPSRKRSLPEWPERIGVVTSASGAVIHDIRQVIERRFPLVEIVLAPTPVQGDEAPPRISQAISDLNQSGQVDVIIVARGGGSREDLWAFNDERVARAIFASRVPVVSAVGHETDVTISDLVADRRAPTPSAAAELVVPDVREVRAHLDDFARALLARTEARFAQAKAEIDHAAELLQRQSPLSTIDRRRSDVADVLKRSILAVHHAQALRRERLRSYEVQLASLNPTAVMRRGFSVCRRLDSGSVVRSVSGVSAGVVIHTQFADGAADSTVVKVRRATVHQ